MMTCKAVTCALIGEGSLLIECGRMLLERGHSIGCVITTAEAVVAWAGRHELHLLEPGPDLPGRLAGIRHDWLFSIGHLQIVPGEVWRQARIGALNFHDGPLPRYAGLNAPAWALMAGERNYGVTWHGIADRVDEGDIYVQQTFPISDEETAFSLNTKCFEAGLESFSRLIGLIEAGPVMGVPQGLADRTYYARTQRPRAAGTLDPTTSVGETDRLIRALTFGTGQTNPLGLPKIRIGGTAYVAPAAEIAVVRSATPAGQVVAVDESGAAIAAADGLIRIPRLVDELGLPVALSSVLREGVSIDMPRPEETAKLDAVIARLARQESYFATRLGGFRDIELDGIGAPGDMAGQAAVLPLALPTGFDGVGQVALLAAALARVSGQQQFDVLFRDDALAGLAAAFPGYIAGTMPLAVAISERGTVGELVAAIATEVAGLQRREGYAADLAARLPRPAASRGSVAIVLREPVGDEPVRGCALTFVVAVDGLTGRLVIDQDRIPRETAERMCGWMSVAMAAAAADGATAVQDLPLLSVAEQTQLIDGRNATARAHDRTALIASLIEAQVDRKPDAVAVSWSGRELTYRQLDERANRLARRLVALGVERDTLVGVHMHRSCDLVVAVLAVLKAGGAYVPLDPTYPAERVALMVEDSRLSILISEPGLGTPDAPHAIRTLTVENRESETVPSARLPARAAPESLAYVIYTSGSTGRPKGVMVEQRNVVNFFAGMDDRIALGESRQPVWLAVTSLSFDISVLELLWTLTRGFKVVVHTTDRGHDSSPRPTRPIELGLFFWGDDDAVGGDKYKLLLDGARFADANGFTAVWTPERHFHAFGGPYPNPAVTGAAVAAVTRNVAIRAGSCVLPLHHPARVAEEWAVVDNISGGRAAIAVAAGWMPEDFVLRPENAPPRNRSAMLEQVEIVRRLWRGEAVAFDMPGGKRIEVTTQPRPVQRELTVWVTTAGNVETFRDAARIGANVLTHLLGQTIDEVALKVRAYREALIEHGRDPSQHKVTLMLHTLVGHDRNRVRELAREPMKRYLRSAATLIKDYAWAFPAFKRPSGVTKPVDIDLQSLAPDELDAIIEFAFERYFEESGLFGTVDEAVARVAQLADLGFDEIACLIDFGVPAQTALEALAPLAQVVAATRSLDFTRSPDVETPRIPDASVGELIRAHRVTHLQCTPAMATMLLADEGDRSALGLVEHLMIGGEALHGRLLKALRQATSAHVENMYGPTETTIWSSTTAAHETDGIVPLGTPIANTQLYILDERRRPVPAGMPGELYIGGEGVTRGYLGREDLTRERFLPDPYVAGGRIYRTGDLVRLDANGSIQFIGRADHQVKLRGFRIELGEIEACLGLHPAIEQVVVMARQDVPGDARIVAYVSFRTGPITEAELRAHVAHRLPDFMVPSHFVIVERWPLTPNAKIDRKALLPPSAALAPAEAKDHVDPAGDTERAIAAVFRRVLGIERVGARDNFFALGGHSLLAVQAHREIKAAVAAGVSITDIYRHPTVAGLAAHIRGGESAGRKQLDKVADRAAQRRAAMTRRRPASASPES